MLAGQLLLLQKEFASTSGVGWQFWCLLMLPASVGHLLFECLYLFLPSPYKHISYTGVRAH